MQSASVHAVASAVLYEGYILYPYRPALKNRQRWTFGGLYPRSYSEAHHGSDAWSMQIECLLQGDGQAELDVTIRFLHLMARTAGELAPPLADWPDDFQNGRREPEFRPVAALQVGRRQYAAWQEAVEREITFVPMKLDSLLAQHQRQRFAFAGSRRLEPVRCDGGEVVGLLVREQQPVEGAVEVGAVAVGSDAFRLSLTIFNETALEEAGQKCRDDALMRSLVSTHAVLAAQQGEFISLMDPPERYREAAAQCRNVGAWPVLVGDAGRKDAMLAAPIILYDYPQVAPESPGDLFDCTEIDELLTLRILTLTEDEKCQMAAVDERASRLLERTEALAREQLLSLHGALRGAAAVEEGNRHA